MKCLLSKEQMYLADQTAMNDFAVQSAILMENAAHSASNLIKSKINKNKNKNILIFCGAGNNGGDGFAIARHLSEFGNIFVFWIGKKENMSEETLANLNSCIKLEIYTQHIHNEDEIEKINFNADYIIDAMIGIGAGENLRGLAIPILREANVSTALKIAVDIPTGLNPNTGISHEDAFKADHTITMFARKKGMYLLDGQNQCGNIHVATLGVPQKIANGFSNTKIIEHQDLERLLPKRKTQTSKFNYGRVLCIGGSKSMPGAITLSANAAISSGAGLVEMISTQMHPALLPEIMPTILDADENGGISYGDMEKILQSAERASVIAIGPGMGNSEDTIKITKEIIAKYKETKKIVVDADALRAISIDEPLSKNVILTPHIVELSRIINCSVNNIAPKTEEVTREYAKKLNCILLLKGVPTIISDGDSAYFNIYGNPGMATAGSGDVLTGVIASILAQGKETLIGTAIASYLHSKAGDIYAEEYGEYSLTASELLRTLQI